MHRKQKKHTFGSVPLVLIAMISSNTTPLTTRARTHRIVSTIFVPPPDDSALNWIICPGDKGKEGLWAGEFPVS
jgi:hypothetical protein